MRLILMTLIFLFSLLPVNSIAQFKGIWSGYINAINKVYKSYYILNIKEEFDGVLKGDAYLFRNSYIIFLGKMNFIATVKNDAIELSELKILINKKPSPQEEFCIKNMSLEKAYKDSVLYLTGNWHGNTIQHYPCDPGKVYLKRQQIDTALFPQNIISQLSDSTTRDSIFNTQLSLPRVIEVVNRNVKIMVKDYDQLDNDIISVFLDRVPIINRARLRRNWISKKITINGDGSNIGELIFYAHNLGKIPPNTCILVIDDGFKKQEVDIGTSLSQSALIYLRYKKNAP